MASVYGTWWLKRSGRVTVGAGDLAGDEGVVVALVDGLPSPPPPHAESAKALIATATAPANFDFM